MPTRCLAPVILFFLFSFSHLAAAQPYPVEQGGLWGYIDATGEVVVEPAFEEAAHFSDGLARIRSGDRYGFIDASGEVVVEPRFVGAGHFNEGLAYVRLDGDGDWGYADRTGEVVIEPRFTHPAPFSEGLAGVYVGSDTRAEARFGYIDTTGTFVVEPQFWGARRFSEGLAPVMTGGFVDGEWGYIDREGTLVIEPQFAEALPFANGRAAVAPEDDGFDTKWGYIDREGALVIPARFALARRFDGGLAPIRDVFDRWRFIDREGEVALKSDTREPWTFAEPFHGPLARVATEGGGGGHGHQGGPMSYFIGNPTWTYIDRDGARVWPAETPGPTGSVVLENDAYGVGFRFPARWNASWGRIDDPFAAGSAQAGSVFRDTRRGEEPEGWNALLFEGPDAPPGLLIAVHEQPPEDLGDLVERMRETAKEVMGAAPEIVEADDVRWNGFPAHRIVYAVPSLGLRGRYVLAYHDGLRFTLWCTDGFAGDEADCRTALHEHLSID